MATNTPARYFCPKANACDSRAHLHLAPPSPCDKPECLQAQLHVPRGGRVIQGGEPLISDEVLIKDRRPGPIYRKSNTWK